MVDSYLDSCWDCSAKSLHKRTIKVSNKFQTLPDPAEHFLNLVLLVSIGCAGKMSAQCASQVPLGVLKHFSQFQAYSSQGRIGPACQHGLAAETPWLWAEQLHDSVVMCRSLRSLVWFFVGRYGRLMLL